MSNVRSKQRSEHRFTVSDIVLELYEHTTTVTSNQKIFDGRFQGLTDRIDNEVTTIYHLCRSANEDYDNRIKEEAEMRIAMQQEALKRWKLTQSHIQA